MNRRSQFALLVLVSLSLAAAGCGVAQRASSDPATAPEPTTAVRAPEASVDATPAAATVASSTAGAPARGATTNRLSPIRGIVRGIIGEVVDPISSDVAYLVDPSVTPTSGDLLYLPAVVQLVLPGLESHVEAGRWQLDFHLGSLLLPKPISISQASDGTMRVEFGPDGTLFGTPVDVSVGYAGTAADPDSPNFKPGTRPAFYWWDPAHSVWVEQPCTVDASNKVLHAKLHHFSRYCVGGKAGW